MNITNLNPDADIGASAWLVELGEHRILLDAGMHPKREGRDGLPLFGKATGAEQVLEERKVGIQHKVLTRGEINRIWSRLSESGHAILIASSDAEELVDVCHRVIVLRNGRKVGELSGATLSEKEKTELVAVLTGEQAASGETAGFPRLRFAALSLADKPPVAPA